jgi:hypothetical protein
MMLQRRTSPETPPLLAFQVSNLCLILVTTDFLFHYFTGVYVIYFQNFTSA